MNSGTEKLDELSSVLHEWAMRREGILEVEKMLMNNLDEQSQILWRKNPAGFLPVPMEVCNVRCCSVHFFDGTSVMRCDCGSKNLN